MQTERVLSQKCRSLTAHQGIAHIAQTCIQLCPGMSVSSSTHHTACKPPAHLPGNAQTRKQQHTHTMVVPEAAANTRGREGDQAAAIKPPAAGSSSSRGSDLSTSSTRSVPSTLAAIASWRCMCVCGSGQEASKQTGHKNAERACQQQTHAIPCLCHEWWQVQGIWRAKV